MEAIPGEREGGRVERRVYASNRLRGREGKEGGREGGREGGMDCGLPLNEGSKEVCMAEEEKLVTVPLLECM